METPGLQYHGSTPREIFAMLERQPHMADKPEEKARKVMICSGLVEDVVGSTIIQAPRAGVGTGALQLMRR
jgi:hypothetical protein